MKKIYIIRGEQVMLDSDLAYFYEVEQSIFAMR
ncbi:MAG: ORF6N domain-containing protein [Bacteroidetes bacterium]|nr:ORF6N domain-containing protein [Bacteroidota bacterium]MBU1115550.1 ORF6N domain-containing protein [Bacteroidota bacterium]MBU1797706.1 ORF6N domain-containing protein [Bacteroidota bacterium]